jgi:hypothetical protein
MYFDDSGFMWLDTASTGGAASQQPTLGNALLSGFCCASLTSTTLQLNAGQGYPIRFQFGNDLGSPSTNVGQLIWSCSINGGTYERFTTGGPCGTLYYNPATTTSATLPGY